MRLVQILVGSREPVLTDRVSPGARGAWSVRWCGVDARPGLFACRLEADGLNAAYFLRDLVFGAVGFLDVVGGASLGRFD